MPGNQVVVNYAKKMLFLYQNYLKMNSSKRHFGLFRFFGVLSDFLSFRSRSVLSQGLSQISEKVHIIRQEREQVVME